MSTTKRNKEIREQKSREEKIRKDKKKRRKNRLCERESILQTFYHKNMFKNTLNYKLTLL